MILAVDNGSSYTDSLADLLRDTGISYEIKPFGAHDLDIYAGYILSGRRRNDASMNMANSRIIRHAINNDKPLLGICYGAELLALTCGGTIRRATTPVRGLERITTTGDNLLCRGSAEVYESHSYEIAYMPAPLVRLAHSASCKNEIIQYGILPIFGTQFHPEMTEDGHAMIWQFVAAIP